MTPPSPDPSPTAEPFRAAVFPGAHSASVYYAVEAGLFAAGGLDVQLTEVRSSREQLAAWDRGELEAVHTSADHFVRGRRPVAGRLLRVEPVGELVVYARGDLETVPAAEQRWGVDAADSGFSFVLRAVVEDALGAPVGGAQLVEVGGTQQRLAALLDGAVDGATLHSPFDVAAEAAGKQRVGGHADVDPELLTNACFVRADLADGRPARYDAALAASRAALLERGSAEIERLLVARGLPAQRAGAAARGALGPFGLASPTAPDRRGLRAAAALRQRFVPGWSPDEALIDELMGG